VDIPRVFYWLKISKRTNYILDFQYFQEDYDLGLGNGAGPILTTPEPARDNIQMHRRTISTNTNLWLCQMLLCYITSS